MDTFADWTRTEPKRVITDGKSSARNWAPYPDVFVQSAKGHYTTRIAEDTIHAMDALVMSVKPGQRVTLFFDWMDVPSYDSDARIVLTKWNKSRTERLSQLHFATTATFMRMGITVANLALGGKILFLHDNIPALDKAITSFMASRS